MSQTLYKKRGSGSDVLLVRVYVDDIVIFGISLKMVSEFKECMKNAFEMSDLGVMKYFLGLEVRQDEHSIHICQ